MSRRAAHDKRLVFVVIFSFICLAAIGVRLVFLQVIDAGRYQKLALQQRSDHIQVSSKRGTILDRDGEVMAVSEDAKTIYATPYLVKDPKKVARKIFEVLGEDEDEVLKKLTSDSGFAYIARKVDPALAKKIEKCKFEGIGFIDESRRYYPLGKSAAQTIGIVDIDNKGQSGVELFYEDLLGGKPGRVYLEKDASGKPIPGTVKTEVTPVDGTDIQLTLDAEIQKYIAEVMEEGLSKYSAKSATALVMECNTGNVLAMATTPGFDPQSREDLKPERIRSRAVTDVYEPGSALKIVTASAALSEGIVNPNTPIAVPPQLKVADKVFSEATPHKATTMTFSQVISKSSNVGTIKVGLQLGEERLAKYLDKFGLGHKTGVDFPGEVGGIVPPVDKWSGTTAATISIGQGISLTPLQLACVAGTVANGGRRIYPHFLKATATKKGMTDAGFGGLGEEVLPTSTCAELTNILEQVVVPGGTGQKAAVKYYRVAGKTGTARKPLVKSKGYGGGYMATFVGFAPAEKPKVVCLVVLDEPSPIWGGETSAPLFSKIMEFTLHKMNIPPSVPVE